MAKNKHHSPHLQKAWNKYGPEAFAFTVIEVVEELKNLISREQFYIDLYESASKGFNCHPMAGSMLGFKHSAKTRASMSRFQAGRKRPPLSEEEKARLRSLRKGVRHSEETRKAWSVKRKGKKRGPLSAEAKANISKGRKGIGHTAETRLRMSKSHRGKPGHKWTAEEKAMLSAIHKGKKLSAETRRKMSAARKGRVVSDETRKKLSVSLRNTFAKQRDLYGDTSGHRFKLGHKSGMTGRKHSEETKQRMRLAAQRRQRHKDSPTTT